MARSDRYAVKGGVNLRFFFNSIRYSEDMDLDIRSMTIVCVKDTVMDILRSASFTVSLKPFGIETVVPPDMAKAKQTGTTQRFKIHLITASREDLFTKVEFSRRGFHGTAVVQPVSDAVVRAYKVMPVIVPHYDALSATAQKITTLAARSAIQARDVFDIYLLSSRVEPAALKKIGLNSAIVSKAYENVFEVGFEQFRDSVLEYLSEEDRAVYDSAAVWDELTLKVSGLIDGLRKSDG